MNNNDQSQIGQEQSTSSCGDAESELWSIRERELMRRQVENEAEFAQQRAKFMELYRQKEEELRIAQDAITKYKSEQSDMEQKLEKFSSQIEDLQTAAAIAEVGKEDEVAKAKRQHNEELASFQHILDDAVLEAQQNANAKYEAERVQWLNHQQALEVEVHELRSKLSQDREGFLTSITKLVQKRVNAGSSPRDDADLDFNMKKAQEDTELLRSVVSPLEEEINSLKAQLKTAYEHTSFAFLKKEEPPTALPSETAEQHCDVGSKVRELHLSLQTEKASRTDLEMYVNVLNEQKTALAEETDKLRLQLKEVCQTLEQEKLDHASLKRTWQMANDRFLESQRLILSDLSRMDMVLTADQRRQISEMKATDAKTMTNTSNDVSGVKDEPTDLVATSNQVSRPDVDGTDGVFPEQNADSSLSLNSSLTGDQQRALRDPTPESEASQTMLAKAMAKSEPLSLVGKRLVSEEEWDMLQKELMASREKIGRPCDGCAAYESQLRGAHDNEKQAIAQLNSMQRQLDVERQAMDKQQKYTSELESSLQITSPATEKQITTLAIKQRESERFLSGVKQQLVLAQHDLLDQLQKLTENRESVQRELTRLQEENESLIGKHSKHAQEMQDEAIDLPNTVEEMQLLVLRYREELITAKVSQEHQEGILKSEIMFIRDQIVAEQQERSTMEESLAQEISHLQQELDIRSGLSEELEREKQKRLQVETKCKDVELSEATLRRTIADIESQILNLDSTKTKLEAEVQRLKIKVSSLQVDLENSEAVQRDFVKLSQSLQIQLEKIRASENEVRWQHEEDAEDCNNCKQVFSVTRRKHHCRHCGQIFCVDCLSKTVNSGPHQRPARVCDVCHTILVRDATPFFCTEPLHTPE